MLRPLLLTALVTLAGCTTAAPRPTTPEQPAPPPTTQATPLETALETLKPQLGTVVFEAADALFKVNGLLAAAILFQSMEETMVVHCVSPDDPFGDDFVLAIYNTDDRTLLEATLFVKGASITLAIDPDLRGEEE